MAVKTKVSAVNTEIDTKGLLKEIVSSVSLDDLVESITLLSHILKRNGVEATVKEVVEAVNLGVKEGVLRIVIVADDERWVIVKS